MNKKLLAALLVVGFGATACSGDTEPQDPDRSGHHTVGPDGAEDDYEAARAYFEDYESPPSDMDAAGAPAAVDSAQEGAADAGGDVPQPVTPEPPPADVIPIPPEPPGPGQENTFTDVGDTVFVDTGQESQSTFGLDVDTGSYRVAQKMVADGMRPERDSIRIEEWVNAFSYGDSAAQEDALALSVKAGATPRADGTGLVRIGVASQEIADEDRPRANITFVIDTSGSMDIRERLGLVQSSLALLVESLNPEDTISIVIYGSDAEPLLEPTRVADRDTIIGAIDELRPGGSTNMEAGLRMGYEQAREGHLEDGINVVVLASDGVANVGVSDGEELAADIAGAGDEGIHLVTVGYGMGNYNDTLMEQLANQGDGFYAYVDTFEQAQELFVEQLTPTLTVVARDAKTQVEFDPELIESFRLVGYQNRALENEEFRDDTVDAGEIGAGHQVSALYELVPADGVELGDEVGEVRLRWADVDSGEVTEVNAPITWSQEEASDSLALAAVVADSAELLRGNTVVTERGLTLEGLQTEAAALADRDVAGAADLARFLDEVSAIEPLPEADGDETGEE